MSHFFNLVLWWGAPFAESLLLSSPVSFLAACSLYSYSSQQQKWVHFPGFPLGLSTLGCYCMQPSFPAPPTYFRHCTSCRFCFDVVDFGKFFLPLNCWPGILPRALIAACVCPSLLFYTILYLLFIFLNLSVNSKTHVGSSCFCFVSQL